MPLNGWLVDRVGAKRLYLLCFGSFTLASVCCGSAGSIEGLVCARVLQGAAGGLLAPMTTMMIARAAGKHLARAMGYTAVPVLVAPIVGPVLAGAILKYARWPWLFYINLPIGLFALGLAAYLLPEDAIPQQRRPFDALGFARLSLGLGCVLYGLEEAAHRRDLWVLALGALLLTGFAWHEWRQKTKALLDIGLFANPIFRAATRTQFLANGVTYAGQFLVPLYLISGHGLSATQAGWLMAPMGVGMMCSQPSMGFLTEKYGCRAGTVAYGAVPKEKLASGATAINIVQRLGGPTATTVMGIVVSLSTITLPSKAPDAFLLPFCLLLTLQGLLFASAWRLPSRDSLPA